MARCPIRQGDGSGGEGAGNVDDATEPVARLALFDQPIDREFHCVDDPCGSPVTLGLCSRLRWQAIRLRSLPLLAFYNYLDRRSTLSGAM